MKPKNHTLIRAVPSNPNMCNHEYQIAANIHMVMVNKIAIIKIIALTVSLNHAPRLRFANVANAKAIITRI